MKEQIIHCNHSLYRGTPYKGSTWILSESLSDNRYVDLQYSLCSDKDNYCRKTGVAIARLSQKESVLKTRIRQVMINKKKDKPVVIPDWQQIYQAVIRL